jgi:hypothetical protein
MNGSQENVLKLIGSRVPGLLKTLSIVMPSLSMYRKIKYLKKPASGTQYRLTYPVLNIHTKAAFARSTTL